MASLIDVRDMLALQKDGRKASSAPPASAAAVDRRDAEPSGSDVDKR